MKYEYIVNYDVMDEGGKVMGWGNQTLTISSDEVPNAQFVADHIRKRYSDDIGIPPENCRIVGIFRL